MAAITSIIIAGVAIAGTAISIQQQRKASKEQRRQNKVSNRIAANKRMRDIRRSIAAQRIRRGEIQAQGFQFGVSGSSAVAGATGGLRSDLASNIGASNQQFTGQQAITSISDRISSLQSSASTFGSIASIAGNFTGGEGSAGAQNRAAVSGVFGS